LWLVSRTSETGSKSAGIPREVFVNGSIVLLIGAFFIGWASGEKGFVAIASFIDTPFKGVLCLFLLDMGLVAGRFLRETGRQLRPPVMAAALYMPAIGALCAVPVAMAIGVSTGSAALLITLAASASYIAVPAALRIALPQANPAIYLTLSLGLTFPFNLTLGIPIYIALAQSVT
ncbi:MAG: sodium-dependent bicarbonate transport family permease, partial [Pseudomonadota bacterium]